MPIPIWYQNQKQNIIFSVIGISLIVGQMGEVFEPISVTKTLVLADPCIKHQFLGISKFKGEPLCLWCEFSEPRLCISQSPPPSKKRVQKEDMLLFSSYIHFCGEIMLYELLT